MWYLIYITGYLVALRLLPFYQISVRGWDIYDWNEIAIQALGSWITVTVITIIIIKQYYKITHKHKCKPQNHCFFYDRWFNHHILHQTYVWRCKCGKIHHHPYKP